MLRERDFQTAILLQNAFDAALTTWLARIPERIGYSRDMRRLLLTKAVPVRKARGKGQGSGVRGPDERHHVYYYLNLLKESLNIEPKDIEPQIHLKEEETKEAKTLLNSQLSTPDPKLLIGINPGAAYGSAKRWLPERFAEVIRRVITELNGRVILFGSKAEIEIANEITSHFSLPTSHFLNLAGKTDLRQLAALISECDAFVTNDSGPMHMASALLVPVVAVFGSTDSAATGPFGEGHKIVNKNLSCSPCMERECPEKHLKCMTDITTDDVFSALKEILPEQKAVFLDRDGTLNEDTGYLNSFSNLRIFEGVKESLNRLKNAGFKLIGITNQSGIARGIVSEEFVRACNDYLQKTLGIDDFYYCPHHPDEKCPCRKPGTRLVRKARLNHHINFKTSYVIGDKSLDVLLAKAVGAKGILVQTGHDMESEHADFIAKNLTEAADWILKQEYKSP